MFITKALTSILGKKILLGLVGVLFAGGFLFGANAYITNVSSLRTELADVKHSQTVLNAVVLSQQKERQALLQAVSDRDRMNKELNTRWVSIRNVLKEINDDEAIDWRNTRIPESVLNGLLSIEHQTTTSN